VLFVIQRTDCARFTACAELDPLFARTLGEAADQGVEVLAYGCEIATEGVKIGGAIPWTR
jgi:sugar fermentation stimulation protein A